MNNQLHNVVNDGCCFSNDFNHNVLFSNFFENKNPAKCVSILLSCLRYFVLCVCWYYYTISKCGWQGV